METTPLVSVHHAGWQHTPRQPHITALEIVATRAKFDCDNPMAMDSHPDGANRSGSFEIRLETIRNEPIPHGEIHNEEIHNESIHLDPIPTLEIRNEEIHNEPIPRIRTASDTG